MNEAANKFIMSNIFHRKIEIKYVCLPLSHWPGSIPPEILQLELEITSLEALQMSMFFLLFDQLRYVNNESTLYWADVYKCH